MKNCHEEFVREWNDYPSQDNEGYVPDRGGFKCGFHSAWRIQEREVKILGDRIESLTLRQKTSQGALKKLMDKLRDLGVDPDDVIIEAFQDE